MAWPDTYKDRYEVLQRAVRIMVPYLKYVSPRMTEGLGKALAADPEVVCEIAEATGEPDRLAAVVDRVLGEQGAKTDGPQ